MQNNLPALWHSTAPILIPAHTDDVPTIVNSYAITLRPEDKRSLINAFSNQDYGMAASFIWGKSMSRLRSKLAKLGMRFLGEMLNREDITDFSQPESSLTDYNTLFLAEALGFVDDTGAMRMRQGIELVSHFNSDKASEPMASIEACSIIRACVQYVFGRDEDATAINFSQFRERLYSQTINHDDVAVSQLLDSPLFFIRTTLRTLLAASKIEESARLEHALANLNTLLPGMWPKLSDEDRWSVGTTFAELSNVGTKPNSIAGVRKALLRVKGFDFVPENLRSNSFKRAAQALISTHYASNNFYNEPEPAKQLASMGSSIPAPAVAECIRAYLCVYLGNRYGQCWDAAKIAENELAKIGRDRWENYLAKILPSDDDILYKLTEPKPISNWIELSKKLEFGKLSIAGWVGLLIKASTLPTPNRVEIENSASALRRQFRSG